MYLVLVLGLGGAEAKFGRLYLPPRANIAQGHNSWDHPQFEYEQGGGEEEDGSGQLQEERRHPLTSQLDIFKFFIIKLCNIYF